MKARPVGERHTAPATDDDRASRAAPANARFGWTKRQHDFARWRRMDVVLGEHVGTEDALAPSRQCARRGGRDCGAT